MYYIHSLFFNSHFLLLVTKILQNLTEGLEPISLLCLQFYTLYTDLYFIYSTPKRNMKQSVPDPNGNNDSGYAPSNLEDTIREHVSPPGSPGLKDATVLKNMACDNNKWKKNGKSKSSTDSRYHYLNQIKFPIQIFFFKLFILNLT